MNEHSAALICRVSSREQEEGYSLEAQEQLLRDYCDRKGLKIVEVMSFSETASKYTQRKKFQEFLKAVKKCRIQNIVAEKVDRLSRSGSRDSVLIDIWIEEDADRRVHFVKQSLEIHKHAPAAAKFVWNMHVAVAKHAADNLSEEVTKAADTMLRKGIWPARTKIGYMRIKSENASPFQIDPLMGPLVSNLFSLYDTGDWSIMRLAEYAANSGLRNTAGKPLPQSRVHTLLKDPFYMGVIRFRGKTWAGVHQPLISVELFERVQNRMEHKVVGVTSGKVHHHLHLMRTIAVCKSCSRRVTWEVHGDKTYGYCKNRIDCGDRLARRQDSIEKEVVDALRNLEISSPRLRSWLEKALNTDDGVEEKSTVTKQEALKNEKVSVLRKLERLVEMRMNDEITKNEYELKRSEQQLELQKIEVQLDDRADLFRADVAKRSRHFQIAQELATSYQDGDAAHRHELLSHVFELIRAGNDGVEVVYRRPFNKLAEAVRISNASKIPKHFDFENSTFESLKSSSDKKKNQPLTVGHPIWWAAWDAYRHSEPEIPQES